MSPNFKLNQITISPAIYWLATFWLEIFWLATFWVTTLWFHPTLLTVEMTSLALPETGTERPAAAPTNAKMQSTYKMKKSRHCSPQCAASFGHLCHVPWLPVQCPVAGQRSSTALYTAASVVRQQAHPTAASSLTPGVNKNCHNFFVFFCCLFEAMTSI